MNIFYLAHFNNCHALAQQFEEAYLPVQGNYTQVLSKEISSDIILIVQNEILELWDLPHTLFFHTQEEAYEVIQQILGIDEIVEFYYDFDHPLAFPALIKS